MNGNDTASLVYLSLFGLLIGGSYLLANRNRMGKVAQQAAIWFFIFVGAVVVIGNWDRISDAALPVQRMGQSEDGGIVVDVASHADGHYYVALDLNGHRTPLVVDTGASDLVLSKADARAAGLDPDALRYFGSAYTANGTVRTAAVRIDEVRLGDIVDRNVPAVVVDGDLQISLLGMTYLQKFGRIEIADGHLRLIR